MDPRVPLFESMLKGGTGCVVVEIESARGSSPREAGAFMLVTMEATVGTIGGGQLEYMAIDRARQMLKRGETEAFADIGLGPEIGQCCGGRVDVRFQKVDAVFASEILAKLAAEFASRPYVYVFGAGHVGNAIVRALGLLPVRTILIDTRLAELAAAPADTETRHVAVPEDEVRDAPPGSALLVLTHDHALDFLIVREALVRADLAYVGMIGSKTKRATFKSWFLREGGDEKALARLVCPMGSTAVKDKRPEVIAALTAAEVMTALDVTKVRSDLCVSGR
jgi:xanthine dehydrogenase accessory factor